MIEKCRYNDIGVAFIVTIKEDGVVVDLSGMTQAEIVFRRPDGSRLVKTAVLADLPSAGQIKYISLDGDLTQLGKWRLQAHVILPSGNYRSDLGDFEVEKVL